jgi:hypothetical protein
MLKTLIVYGNCQAEAVATILRTDPVTKDCFHVLYLRSFDHPSDGQDDLRPAEVGDCVLLWEQHDPQPFPYRELLPASCLNVRFPAIDFNLLWPFNCPNPYDEPEPPIFPFGRFPYGDRIIIDAIDRQMPPEEIISYHLSGWARYGMDLDRLFQIESARLVARDTHCDVKMSDFVLERFRKERLFWTSNHPTKALLRELIHRLRALSIAHEPLLDALDLDVTIGWFMHPEAPLGIVSVPVHPNIAEHFGLEWYDADKRHQGFGGASYASIEYFEAMVRHSIAVKRSRES